MPASKCELCGKSKLHSNMHEYYVKKRSDAHRIMRKCKDCNNPQEEPMGE